MKGKVVKMRWRLPPASNELRYSVACDRLEMEEAREIILPFGGNFIAGSDMTPEAMDRHNRSVERKYERKRAELRREYGVT